jgi:hypothetical protein
MILVQPWVDDDVVNQKHQGRIFGSLVLTDVGKCTSESCTLKFFDGAFLSASIFQKLFVTLV